MEPGARHGAWHRGCHGQLRAHDRAHAERLACGGELHRAPDSVVVGDGERFVSLRGGGGRELVGRGGAVEERKARVAVELYVLHA